MEYKLDWVLLVDDDKDCNFFHRRLVSKMNCTPQIDVASDGSEALDILKAMPTPKLPGKGIIFLDINMPGLNGWDFLDEYTRCGLMPEQHVVIIMLSSSLNPDDVELANKYACVNSFVNKPLTKEAVTKILEEQFTEGRII